MTSVIWYLIVAQAAASGLGVLSLRFAGSRFQEEGNQIIGSTLLVGLIGMVLYVASFALWIYILSVSQASYAFPISIGISVVVTTIGAIYILGERISLLQGVGIGLLVVAISIISVFGVTEN